MGPGCHTPSTVLSRTSTHFCINTHPPNFDSLWFRQVLNVAAHYAKFLCGDLKYILDLELHASDTKTSGSKGSHAPVCSFVCSVLHLRYKFTYCMRQTPLRLGNEATGGSFSCTIQPFSTAWLASFDQTRAK